MNLLNWKGYAIAGAAGALIAGIAAGWGAWAWQANSYERQLSDLRAEHAQAMGQVSALAARQAGETLEWLQRAGAAVAEVDAQQLENGRVKAENDRLTAELASGARRVFVRAKCPAPTGGNAVPGHAGTARVDDAETRAELDPAFAGSVAGIAGDGDDAIRQLTGLQDYVTNVCLAPRTPAR